MKSYSRGTGSSDPSRKSYSNGQFLSSGRSGRSGPGHLSIRIGDGHRGGSGCGYRYYNDCYGHTKRYYSYCGYYGPYGPYLYDGYWYSGRPRWCFGFGLYYSSYPTYPVYVYDPYPVVYTTPTYFITQPVQVVQEPVVIGQPAYGSEPLVGYDNAPEVVPEASAPAYGPDVAPESERSVQIQQEMQLLQESQPQPEPQAQPELQPQPEAQAQPESQSVPVPPEPRPVQPAPPLEPQARPTVPPPSPSGESRPAGMPSDQVQRQMADGVKAFAAGEYEEAAASFLKVAMADPNNVDATLAYATARFATGDYSMSAVALRRGVRRMPEVVNALFDLRDRYDRLIDFDAHLKALEAFVQEHPDDADALAVLGFVQHFMAERASAAETFKHLKDVSKADADLADIFLNAKPLEELLPPDESEGAGARSEPVPPASQPAAS